MGRASTAPTEKLRKFVRLSDYQNGFYFFISLLIVFDFIWLKVPPSQNRILILKHYVVAELRCVDLFRFYKEETANV